MQVIRSLPLLLITTLLTVHARSQGQTVRVSTDTTGLQGNLNSGGYYWGSVAVSADARYVAFNADANNLVSGDVGGHDDVFLKDMVTGQTTLLSVSSTGQQANNTCISCSLSADARLATFSSTATNLVANDINNQQDVFLRDRVSGTTSLVSVDIAGQVANGASYAPLISTAGQFVIFSSDATDLVAQDANNKTDVFLRDLVSGTTELISVSTAGAQGNNVSFAGGISADGRFVAFASGASNFVIGDNNNTYDVFVRDRQLGTTTCVDLDLNGVPGNLGVVARAAISDDGRFVVFASKTANLAPNDTNSKIDVFVRDLVAGATELVSVDPTGLSGNGDCYNQFSISRDGRYVAFDSGASNLVSADTNGAWDVFVRDRLLGVTARADVDSNYQEVSGNCAATAISDDGLHVAFASDAPTLVPGDTNGALDVFLHLNVSPSPTVYCTPGITTHVCVASIHASAQPSLSMAHPCTISVSNVEGVKSGLVFYGIDNAGFVPSPWGTGTSFLCVKAPAQRTGVQGSGGTLGQCDGSFSLDWNAHQLSHPTALGAPWAAGANVYAQAWFRDPPAPKSTNLSDAIRLTYLP